VLLQVLSRVRAGDFAARMPVHWTGQAGKVADQLNDIIGANEALGTELDRASRIVGKEGKLSHRVSFKGTDQVWGECIESVNGLIDDLVRPSNEMQRVIGAVADGDLSKKVSGRRPRRDARPEEHDQRDGRPAQRVRLRGHPRGPRGRHRGQARSGGRRSRSRSAGVWKDLTDNVNLMAGNLTGQVRDIAEVTTAVANGDLSKKITADVAASSCSSRTPSTRWSTSSTASPARSPASPARSASRASSAARPVQEVAGVWKDLTDDVNQLAANLTDQVRAIAEVATAVTEGDLTRQVSVAPAARSRSSRTSSTR
jgi:HAMP domain-containing protein